MLGDKFQTLFIIFVKYVAFYVDLSEYFTNFFVNKRVGSDNFCELGGCL